jgi:predicted DNA-binding protein
MARITVRLPDDLYARLRLFAHGRSQGHAPDIAAIVREAVEAYITPKGPMADTSSAIEGLTPRSRRRKAHYG